MRRSLCPGALVAAALVAAGCADQFDPYTHVVGHRVLAVRASPPELRPDESAVLDALVTSETPAHAWSWCPVPFSEPATGECPIEESELRAMLQAAGSDAEPPPYDLGSEPAATFEHTLPPEVLEAVCEAIRGQPLPEGVARPACDGRYDISVRLVASDGGDEIVAVRELGLLYADDAVPNENPAIGGARIGIPYFDLAGEEPVLVGRGFRYKLELEVPEVGAERYDAFEDGELVSRRESLVVTWFREAGDLDKSRSSFLEGTTDFDNLTTNAWTAPEEEALGGDRVRLYFVLRDSRGGVDWLDAELELVE